MTKHEEAKRDGNMDCMSEELLRGQVYPKEFHLRNPDGSTSTLSIEVWRDEHGVEIVAQSSLEAIERAKIERLKLINTRLLKCCREMLRYIVRKEAHQGCMDSVQLEAAEKRVMSQVSELSTGRWAGDTVSVSLAEAKEAIALAEATPEPEK